MMATEKFSLRSVLTRAEVTQTGDVKPIRDWDTMASGIRQAQNFVVITETEEARLVSELEEIRAKMADARRILDEAKALWIKTSADVLGVGMKVEQ